ncbi:hypothetical protein ACJJTC_000623 [Scirpophaga incertulas]
MLRNTHSFGQGHPKVYLRTDIATLKRIHSRKTAALAVSEITVAGGGRGHNAPSSAKVPHSRGLRRRAHSLRAALPVRPRYVTLLTRHLLSATRPRSRHAYTADHTARTAMITSATLEIISVAMTTIQHLNGNT